MGLVIQFVKNIPSFFVLLETGFLQKLRMESTVGYRCALFFLGIYFNSHYFFRVRSQEFIIKLYLKSLVIPNSTLPIPAFAPCVGIDNLMNFFESLILCLFLGSSLSLFLASNLCQFLASSLLIFVGQLVTKISQLLFAMVGC